MADESITNNTRQIVQRFWDTMNSGDQVRIREFMTQHFAPNMEWHVMGSGVPGAGCISGREKIMEVIGGVRGLFEPGKEPRGVVDRMVVEGQWAAAQTEATGTLRDGRVYRNRYAFFLEVSGPQMQRLYEYFDTFYVHELFDKKP